MGFALGPPYSRGNYGQIGLKKQVLAVKFAGGRRIQEKITARMAEKARIGRKICGSSLDSRENYGQIGRKSKIWP